MRCIPLILLTNLNKILKHIALYIIVLTVCLALLFFYARQLEPKLLLVSKSKVTITNLPKELAGIRIVQISDLHGKLFPANELIDKVNALRPDILVITGDVIDPFHRDYSYIHQVLGPMQAKYGKYYVSGNNEYDPTLSWNEMEKAYLQAKVAILHNQNTRINYKGSYLWLVGVDDPNTNRDRLDQALRGTDQAPKLLLAHSPEIINKAKEKNIDLVLVGHTHGGQVRIPGLTQRPGVKVRLHRVLAKANYWVNRGINYIWRRGEQINDSYLQELQFPKLNKPEVNLKQSEMLSYNMKPGFERYVAGLYSIGNTQMYVNRGLGETRIPFRLFSLPEITAIELITEQN